MKKGVFSSSLQFNTKKATTQSVIAFLLPATGIEPVREVSPAGFYVLCVCQFRHAGWEFWL